MLEVPLNKPFDTAYSTDGENQSVDFTSVKAAAFAVRLMVAAQIAAMMVFFMGKFLSKNGVIKMI